MLFTIQFLIFGGVPPSKIHMVRRHNLEQMVLVIIHFNLNRAAPRAQIIPEINDTNVR